MRLKFIQRCEYDRYVAVQSFRTKDGCVGKKQGVLNFGLILPYFESKIDYIFSIFFCSWVVAVGCEKKIYKNRSDGKESILG